MKRWWVPGVASLAALLVGGVAAAEGSGAAPSPTPPLGGITRQVTLTPKEEMTQAESFLTRMDSSRNVVRTALQAARAQRDVVKTLCLNDKLTQMDVAYRSARERKDELASAAQRQDAEAAEHEFTILSVLRQRSDQLAMEANLCVGQIPFTDDPTSVDVKIDPNIPPDPFDWGKISDQVIIQPGECASCFK